MGLPLSPGYRKKRSRPSNLCLLRRDITEPINLPRLDNVDSIVVNLQETRGEAGKEGFLQNRNLHKALWFLPGGEHTAVTGGKEGGSTLLRSPSQHGAGRG